MPYSRSISPQCFAIMLLKLNKSRATMFTSAMCQLNQEWNHLFTKLRTLSIHHSSQDMCKLHTTITVSPKSISLDTDSQFNNLSSPNQDMDSLCQLTPSLSNSSNNQYTRFRPASSRLNEYFRSIHDLTYFYQPQKYP